MQRSEPTAAPTPLARRWRLPLIIVAALGLAAVGLWGKFPNPRDFVAAVTGADYWWIALAGALQLASLGAFAWQQRRILKALGVRVPAGRTMAITFARTAISISIPAGGAVSAGYAVREYQRMGTPKQVGAASMIVSGLASISGLTLLYVVGGAALVSQNPNLLLSPQPLAIVAGVLVLTTAVVLLGRRRLAQPVDESNTRLRSDGRFIDFLRRMLREARAGWRAGAALHALDWITAVLLLTVNWFTDLLCLIATCRAVGLPVDVTTLSGIYLGVQIVRQVPLTPGGVGVIDTALIAGLTAAGATSATAAAAVLIYRLISCWLLLPIGGIAALALRRGTAPTTHPALDHPTRQ